MRFFHVHSTTRSALSASFAYSVNPDNSVSYALSVARVSSPPPNGTKSKAPKDVATRKMGTDIAAGRLAKGVCDTTSVSVGADIDWREVEAMVLRHALGSTKLAVPSRVKRDIRARLESYAPTIA